MPGAISGVRGLAMVMQSWMTSVRQARLCLEPGISAFAFKSNISTTHEAHVKCIINTCRHDVREGSPRRVCSECRRHRATHSPRALQQLPGSVSLNWVNCITRVCASRTHDVQ